MAKVMALDDSGGLSVTTTESDWSISRKGVKFSAFDIGFALDHLLEGELVAWRLGRGIFSLTRGSDNKDAYQALDEALAPFIGGNELVHKTMADRRVTEAGLA